MGTAGLWPEASGALPGPQGFPGSQASCPRRNCYGPKGQGDSSGPHCGMCVLGFEPTRPCPERCSVTLLCRRSLWPCDYQSGARTGTESQHSPRFLEGHPCPGSRRLRQGCPQMMCPLHPQPRVSHSQPHPGLGAEPRWPRLAAAGHPGHPSSLASATWHADSGTRSAVGGSECVKETFSNLCPLRVHSGVVRGQ